MMEAGALMAEKDQHDGIAPPYIPDYFRGEKQSTKHLRGSFDAPWRQKQAIKWPSVWQKEWEAQGVWKGREGGLPRRWVVPW